MPFVTRNLSCLPEISDLGTELKSLTPFLKFRRVLTRTDSSSRRRTSCARNVSRIVNFENVSVHENTTQRQKLRSVKVYCKLSFMNVPSSWKILTPTDRKRENQRLTHHHARTRRLELIRIEFVRIRKLGNCWWCGRHKILDITIVWKWSQFPVTRNPSRRSVMHVASVTSRRKDSISPYSLQHSHNDVDNVPSRHHRRHCRSITSVPNLSQFVNFVLCCLHLDYQLDEHISLVGLATEPARRMRLREIPKKTYEWILFDVFFVSITSQHKPDTDVVLLKSSSRNVCFFVSSVS